MTGNCDSTEKKIKRVTAVGLVANFFLTVFKIIAGYFGNSQTVIADGIHSLSDSVTDIAVIIGSSFWSAPPDEEHPHGHRRIETFITAVIGVALLGVAFGIGRNAIVTFNDPDEAPTWIAFAAALISVIVKEALYQYTYRFGKKLKSSAVMANAWHHRSDAISSAPAAVAVIISMKLPDYPYIDNIGALLVSFFIVWTAFKISWDAILELTDIGADKAICESIECAAKGVVGVKSIHKCRTRKYGSGIQVDLHIQVDPEITVREGHAIGHKVEDELFKNHDVLDVIVHVEPFGEDGSEND